MEVATIEEMALARANGNMHAGDERLMVQFYQGSMHSPQKSTEAGRPVYVDVDFIRILVPGDKDTVIDRPVWDDANNPNSHTSRFRAQWLAYKAGQGEAQSGTPLRQWPQVTRSQVEELAHFHVKTVEALAAMPDVHLQKFGGGAALRQKARDYLEAATKAAPMEKLRTELEVRDAQLAAQQAQLAEMAQAIAALKAQQQAATPGVIEGKRK